MGVCFTKLHSRADDDDAFRRAILNQSIVRAYCCDQLHAHHVVHLFRSEYGTDHGARELRAVLLRIDVPHQRLQILRDAVETRRFGRFVEDHAV